MRRFVISCLVGGAVAAFLLIGSTRVAAGGPSTVRKLPVELHECVYCAHGSVAERRLPAKPAGNPGKGRGGGGGGGGAKKPACSRTFGVWTVATIRVFVDPSGAPATISSGTLQDSVQLALDEWACHSGLGESIVFRAALNADDADITIGWGELGSSGVLGQAATATIGGVIQHSAITMNSNQSAFLWTASPSADLDADGCAVEQSNGNTSSNNFDFLSVLRHEIGHALGVAHPNNRCRANDKCYPETMYSCTDAEEFMRRALNAGDMASIESLYGADGP